jgi:hypothetical protein
LVGNANKQKDNRRRRKGEGGGRGGWRLGADLLFLHLEKRTRREGFLSIFELHKKLLLSTK